MKQHSGRSSIYICTLSNKEFNSPKMKKLRLFAKQLGRSLSINGRHSDRVSLLKTMGKEDYNYVSGIYVDIYSRAKHWINPYGYNCFHSTDRKLAGDTKKLREFTKKLFK